MTYRYDTILFNQSYHSFSRFFLKQLMFILLLTQLFLSYTISGWYDSKSPKNKFICRCLVERNWRGTTDVINIILSLASSHDRSLYSLCPVLPSPPHFEVRANSFWNIVQNKLCGFFFLSLDVWSNFNRES